MSASIAFQYYRPQPLWIPISWNVIFLGINVGMVGLILKEESDAKEQDRDTAAIYDMVNKMIRSNACMYIPHTCYITLEYYPGGVSLGVLPPVCSSLSTAW